LRAQPADGPELLRAGEIAINHARRLVTVRGEPVDLSPKEYQILLLLVRHHGKVLTREVLIDEVWGEDFMGDAKALDVHMRWLREKIEPHPSEPRSITTVRGVGYLLE